MKKTNKIFFVLTILISLFTLSCASTPDAAEEKIDEVIENDNSEAEQETQNSEETVPDDLTDLEEKIEEFEILPELPEEISEPDEIENAEPETEKETAPVVIIPEEKPVLEPVEQDSHDIDLIRDALEETKELKAEMEKAKLKAETEAARLEQELEKLRQQQEIIASSENQEKNQNIDSNADTVQQDIYTSNGNAVAQTPVENKDSENRVNNSDSNNIYPEINTYNQKQNDESDSSNDENLIETQEEEEYIPPKPSRTVKMLKNQFIDIVYPGKGWIYQGALDQEGNQDTRNKYFIFGGRKLGGKDQTFTLRSRVAGNYLLHFYKADALTGDYIDDYLEVIVEEKPASPDVRILAPSYAEAVPEKPTITADTIKTEKEKVLVSKNETNNNENSEPAAKKTAVQSTVSPVVSVTSENDTAGKTVIQTTESIPDSSNPTVNDLNGRKEAAPLESVKLSKSEVSVPTTEEDLQLLSSDELLSKAQDNYNSKNYTDALKTITVFFDKAASRIDEGLYLQGQILEDKSPVQNIKDAIESYDLVVRNYPASKLWDKANKRSIFLKRFYINIR